MISRKHNCIFIHITKSGGSSITDLLWPPEERTEENLWMGFQSRYHNKYQTGGLQHLLARYVIQEVSEEFFNQAYKFTMVRNPWDRIVSQYTFMSKRPDLREFIGMEEDCEFKKYLELISKKKHVQWEEQQNFFLDENGEVLVDDILRFENYGAEVSKVLNKLGLPLTEIPHTNKGVRRHYSEYYDRESREFVADMFAEEIRLLGYKYDEQ